MRKIMLALVAVMAMSEFATVAQAYPYGYYRPYGYRAAYRGYYGGPVYRAYRPVYPYGYGYPAVVGYGVRPGVVGYPPPAYYSGYGPPAFGPVYGGGYYGGWGW